MRNMFSAPKSPSPTHRSTFSSVIMEENMEFAAAIFTKWNTDSLSEAKSSRLFKENRTEAKQFLQYVEKLQAAMKYFISEIYSSDLLVNGQNLMQMAMKRLEKEFYIILSDNRNVLNSESSLKSTVSSYNDDVDSDDEDEAESSVVKASELEIAMADLKLIADCMISAGYGKECAKIYKIVRKSVVDETLYYLGVENLSFSNIQKLDWEATEIKIRQWLTATKVAIQTLFRGERILCDHVFPASEIIRESSFAEISTSGAQMLVSFPENIAKCKKSPEKIFRLLDIYELISENLHEIESIFSFESTSTVRSQAVTSLAKIGDAIRATLSEFESAIQKHNSKSVLPGGGVHPLTRYVMNYFVFLGDYNGILTDIFADDDPLNTTPSSVPESYYSSSPDENKCSAISMKLAWIVLVLLCKLDGKAQLYKNVSQSYLFLTNNLNYVVSKVRNSNLKLIFGDDWVINHEIKVQQYASNYERMGWSKVISSLPENPTAEISSEKAKKSFEMFNSSFEELCKKQSTWIVTDTKLREQIKISVENRVVPVYRKFYEKNREFFGFEQSIVRYAPEDLGNYIADLFSGTGVGENTSSYSAAAGSPSNDVRR